MNEDERDAIMKLAEIGLKVEIERCIKRFFHDAGLDPETTPYSPELARKLERFIKLNPGGNLSPHTVKVYKREEES